MRIRTVDQLKQEYDTVKAKRLEAMKQVDDLKRQIRTAQESGDIDAVEPLTKKLEQNERAAHGHLIRMETIARNALVAHQRDVQKQGDELEKEYAALTKKATGVLQEIAKLNGQYNTLHHVAGQCEEQAMYLREEAGRLTNQNSSDAKTFLAIFQDQEPPKPYQVPVPQEPEVTYIPPAIPQTSVKNDDPNRIDEPPELVLQRNGPKAFPVPQFDLPGVEKDNW